MSKSKNKTVPTKVSPTTFIKSLEEPTQKAEAKILLNLFEEVTKTRAVMWGEIFGFGAFHYKSEAGREGDYLATGFAMRKSGPTIYIMPGYNDYSELMEKIGPHKLGKSCLYLKNLNNIHLPTLKKIIKAGLKDLGKKYPVIMR
jgi:hypothetical protein